MSEIIERIRAAQDVSGRVTFHQLAEILGEPPPNDPEELDEDRAYAAFSDAMGLDDPDDASGDDADDADPQYEGFTHALGIAGRR
jgi:hypothetical protein